MSDFLSDARFCEQCLSVKPINEFRRRSRNGLTRLNQCRACHAARERERRAKRNKLADRRRVAKCLTHLKNETSNKRLRLLADVMLNRFGGLQGFVLAWTEYVHHAQKQGGFASFRCLQSFLRLAQYCEENAPDLSQLSDDELQAQTDEHLRRLIAAEPALALAAAESLGWTIVQPASPA